VKWFFIPFKQYDADPSMPQNEARYKQRGVKIVKLGEEGGLKNVKANEILVIAGHGLPMVASLGVTSATMSFGTLAKGETDRVYTMARLPSGATPSRPPDEVLGVNRLLIQDELTAHDLAECWMSEWDFRRATFGSDLLLAMALGKLMRFTLQGNSSNYTM
jgi:hypothetical protein